MSAEHEHDRLLDKALARLARRGGDGPSPGFVTAVMGRLDDAGTMLRFQQLLMADSALQRECAAVAGEAELLAWLTRTAQAHGLAPAPLLACAGRYFVSANDGELDDEALDAVVGAGMAGAGYLATLLRSLQ